MKVNDAALKYLQGSSNPDNVFESLIAPKNLASVVQMLHPLIPSAMWSRNGRVTNENVSRLRWIGSMTNNLHEFVCDRDFIEYRHGAQHDDAWHNLVVQSGLCYGK
jgi:hypothetical protein